MAKPGPQTLQTKEDLRLGVGGRSGPQAPPALLHVMPPRTTKDLGLQFLHGLFPSLPRGPQLSAELLDRDCKSTGGKGAQGRAPLMPRPHTEPIVSGHKGPTQAAALHSWAPSLHGEACARGVQPPAWASSEWGPRSFPPQRCQSVWPGFKPQIQAQILVLYTNPQNEPPLLQRKESSPLSQPT